MNNSGSLSLTKTGVGAGIVGKMSDWISEGHEFESPPHLNFYSKFICRRCYLFDR